MHMPPSRFHSDFCDVLFRANPVPMFLYDNRSLRIVAANRAASARYGYTCREFRSMTVRNLRPGGNGPALDSAVLLDYDAPARSLWTHVTKAGMVFAVELCVVPLRRRGRRLFLMSAVDASAWSEANVKLIRSEHTHRLLVEQCPFGIYSFDLTTGRYQQANPAFLELLGYNLSEFRALAQPAFFPDLSERDRYVDEMCASGRLREIDTHLRTKDGRSLRVTLSAFLYNHFETGHQCIQAYVRDTTRQHQLEEELGHSHRMEAVGRLAGGIAHDFNNIAQSITLSCELALLEIPLPEPTAAGPSVETSPFHAVQNKLRGIMQQAARAAETSQQLLAFSRRQLLQPRIVKLNQIVRNAVPMLTRAAGINVVIDLHLDESVAPILVDPDQLTTCLMHLADNARNAMPHGGVLHISTAPNPPVPNDIPPQPFVVLTVADTGIGMSESVRQHIFEPFFSTRPTTETTGLGLSTVHGIILQSKGRIECESAPGLGATFRIFLPIAVTPAVPAVAAVTSAAAVTAHTHPIRLLLAKDDPIINRHLAQALEEAGFSVHAVSNGEAALAAFSREPYQIVVTDIVMPKLNGIELTRRLRQVAPSLPVVLISGTSGQFDVLQQFPGNPVAYLQKPFTTPMLLALIHNLLSGEPAPENDNRRFQ
jgi:two-component system, cell cycle sensor histidine kinase and response regulator CckA